MARDLKLIGARIRSMRTAQGVGLSALADQLKISKGYLSELENGGDVNPTLDVLRRIADKLGVTLADLFGEPTAQSAFTIPDDEIPDGLAELMKHRRAAHRPLDAATVMWLARAQFRGSQPKSREDFEFLLRSLEASTSGLGKK